MDHKTACERVGITPTEQTARERFQTLGSRILSLPHRNVRRTLHGSYAGEDRHVSVSTRDGFTINITATESYTPGSLVARHLTNISAVWIHEGNKTLPAEQVSLISVNENESALAALEQTVAEAEAAVANQGFISDAERERRARIETAVSVAG